MQRQIQFTKTQLKKQGEQSNAKKNWQKIRNMFLTKLPVSTSSKLKKNQLFKKKTSDYLPQPKLYDQVVYTHQNFQLKIVQKKNINLNKKQLQNYNKQQIDSTGLWIWQAQQILAYFLLLNQKQYSQICANSNIIELGAGSSGLASLVCSKLFQLNRLDITDGRVENLNSIKKSLDLNFQYKQEIRIYQLIWANYNSIQEKNIYDLILISDCLFFKQFHQDLLHTILILLKDKGKVLLVNPSRGGSMQIFLKRANQYMIYNYIEFKDDIYMQWIKKVKNETNYDPDRDNFFIIEMYKRQNPIQKI